MLIVLEIGSVVLILLSFEMLARKMKRGFLTMIIGQLLATILNIFAGLYGMAIMHFIIIITNIRGYKKWQQDENKEANFHH